VKHSIQQGQEESENKETALGENKKQSLYETKFGKVRVNAD